MKHKINSFCCQSKSIKPRIGLDFHVVDGIYQGSRTHVLELFSEVIRLSPDISFFLFLEKTDSLLAISPSFALPNVEIVYMPHANPIKRLCWQLPMLQRKYRLDILHTQYIIPIINNCKGIVTIHDILFESHPQYFSSLFRFRSKILMRLSARRSSHVFTVSEYSKNEMINRYQIAHEGISVLYNGVDNKRFFVGNDGVEVISKRGLTSKRYLLSVGRLEPRKNHVNLLKAFALTRSTGMPLVIVGQPHFGYDSIYQTITDLNIQEKVIIINNVMDEKLPAFYRHAKVFVYPTWAEGFGMPLLEAMASGVPVISSNTTSIPEVVGDSGILVDPGDVDAIATAINDLISDKKLYSETSHRGIERAAMFRWDIPAEKVRNVYFSCLQ